LDAKIFNKNISQWSVATNLKVWWYLYWSLWPTDESTACSAGSPAREKVL